MGSSYVGDENMESFMYVRKISGAPHNRYWKVDLSLSPGKIVRAERVYEKSDDADVVGRLGHDDRVPSKTDLPSYTACTWQCQACSIIVPHGLWTEQCQAQLSS